MNLSLILEMAAGSDPDRVAITDGTMSLTYGELHRVAASLAAGLPPEVDTVAAVGLTGPAFAAALFGAAWGGRSFAPLNHRLPPDQLRALLARLDQTACFATDPLRTIVDGVAFATGSGGDLLAATADDLPAPVDDPERPAILLYTSGTTSEPKAAIVDHDHLLAYVMNTLDFGSADPSEAALVSVPPFHIAGVAAVVSGIWVGRRIVALPVFTAEAWLDRAREESVTHAFVVPTMLARIVEHLESSGAAEAPLPALRHLAYGGAHMPLPVLERALALFPDVAFVNAYGLTETSSTIAVLGPDEHRLRSKLDSVGRPVPGIEIEIVDDDDQPLPVDTTGRIRIRGGQVSGRYVGHEATPTDGWLTTGDLGRMDADGYLYVGARADDLIIRGGENISPAEIEDALLRHEAVGEAAVVGLPDEEWGQRIAAVVVLRADDPEFDPDDLRAHAREVLGALKCPELVLVVDALPTTATGKVIRRALPDLIDEHERG